MWAAAGVPGQASRTGDLLLPPGGCSVPLGPGRAMGAMNAAVAVIVDVVVVVVVAVALVVVVMIAVAVICCG